MKAIKGNKVYKISEDSKKEYLAQGFNIFDDKGKLLEKSPKSIVTQEMYDKALSEISKLKAELKKGEA